MTSIDEILELVKLKWALFPVAGKQPLTDHGFKDASTDPEQIAAWLERWPNCNWAIATGDASGGECVVDIDQHGTDGEVVWSELKAANNYLEPDTPMARTPTGGRHIHYRGQMRSSQSVLGEGVDTKGRGGYALIPPSKGYTWEQSPFDFWPPAPIPDFVLAKLKKTRTRDKVPQGARHAALTRVAAAAAEAGMEPEAIAKTLDDFRANGMEDGSDPVTDKEIAGAVAWAAELDPDPKKTDLGNAQRLLTSYGETLRYVPGWGRWLLWDGKRWAIDKTDQIRHVAQLTARAMFVEALEIHDDDERRRMVSWAMNSESSYRIGAMIREAQVFPGVPVLVDDLNADPWQLNCANGVVDLRTGDLHPHNKNDLMTHIVDVNYRPNAEAPTWESFLDLVTGGDKELELFLQVAAGYSITGLTDEHCVFFLHGLGRNGKSTLLESLRRLLGDYAARTDIESVLARHQDGADASPQVAGLAGKRFVSTTEIPEGRRVAEAVLKNLTGGEAVVARYLHENPFTYRPQFHLWLAGNHKPRIVNQDEGIWRRLRLVPFKVVIGKDIQRPMSQVLAEFATEAEGILSWLVEGCLLWQSNGLDLSSQVQEATKVYRTEQDALGAFLEEACVFGVEEKAYKADLFRSWKNWLKNNNELDLERRSKRWFIQQLTSRGFEQIGAGRDSLAGIALLIPITANA